MCFSLSGKIDFAATEYLHVYNAMKNLVALTRTTIKDPRALSDLDDLQNILERNDDHDNVDP